MFRFLRTVAVFGAVVTVAATVAFFAVPGAGASTPGPVISSFTPTSAAVGATVTISGTNLSGATEVTFNFNSAPIVTDTDSQITTTVPLGDDQGPVAVTTPGGTATSASEFTLTGFYVATTSLPDAKRGFSYDYQLQAAGGTGPDRWTKSTPLPRGITLSRSGVLAGVVVSSKDVPGNYPLTVHVRDSTKHHHLTATATLSLTISQ
jgi:hypothetical protein